MKIVIHANQIEWQKRYARHAREGLKRHGIKATVTNSTMRQPCDIAILMGPNAWQHIERANKPFIMFNRKFVGNDPQVVHENCAISWDGFNGRGTFCVDSVKPERLEKYLTKEEFLPWQRDGQHFLLCEQSNVGRCTKYRTLNEYYKYVKSNAQYPVKFRPKPTSEDKISYESVSAGLKGAKATVVLNSTISIDSIIAGIPVISLDVGDVVDPITSHILNEFVYPERLPLFQYLAHCQWTEDEIKSGKFWEHIYPKRGIKLHEWRNNA